MYILCGSKVFRQDGWALFVGYLYFSKYGSIRLGREDSRPEYNDLTWSVTASDKLVQSSDALL